MNDTVQDNVNDNVLAHLHSALESGRMRRLQPMLHSLHPAEIAMLLEGIPPTKRRIVWELVDPDDHGEILLQLSDEVRAGLIERLDDEVLLAAAEGLDTDDLADLLEDLPETLTQQVLRSMDIEHRQRVESILSYPADSAGGLMNTDTVTVRPDVSIDVVQRYLRSRGELPENTDALFVVNRYGRYLGKVSLDKLLTRDGEKSIAEVMNSEATALDVNLPASQVARHFEDRDLISAPVTDENGSLLGRITIDDVVDTIRDEAEHNFLCVALDAGQVHPVLDHADDERADERAEDASFAGLDEEEDLFAPVITSARRRAVWLGINLFTAFLAARVVGLFEATIEEVVALAVLMPIVASMGGIGGSQTITLMIRGLALGHIGGSNARSLLFKEMSVAIINGIVWSLVVAVIVLVWFGNPMLAVVIGLAMVINQVIAAASGVGLPLLMRRLNIDPALAGSVVLTTITDVVGFAAFLGLGALILL